MKDVIKEEWDGLCEYINANSDGVARAGEPLEISELRRRVNESFLKINTEADFIINRLKGEAGIIERASAKMPRTAELLVKMAQILKGYAARVENSQAPEFQEKRIIRMSEFNGE